MSGAAYQLAILDPPGRRERDSEGRYRVILADGTVTPALPVIMRTDRLDLHAHVLYAGRVIPVRQLPQPAKPPDGGLWPAWIERSDEDGPTHRHEADPPNLPGADRPVGAE